MRGKRKNIGKFFLPRRVCFLVEWIKSHWNSLDTFKVHEANLFGDGSKHPARSCKNSAVFNRHYFNFGVFKGFNLFSWRSCEPCRKTLKGSTTKPLSTARVEKNSSTENYKSRIKSIRSLAPWVFVFLYDSVPPLVASCDIFTWKMFPVGQREYKSWKVCRVEKNGGTKINSTKARDENFFSRATETLECELINVLDKWSY